MLRLNGLEPDNVLAFLALLGVARALAAVDEECPDEERWNARIGWDIDQSPLRPQVYLSLPADYDTMVARVSRGVDKLAQDYSFGDRKDLDYRLQEAKEALTEAAQAANVCARSRIDLLSALMNNIAVNGSKKKDQIAPTPFCLLFGGGHQHFLERLSRNPNVDPPHRGRGKRAVPVSVQQSLAETLFHPWRREDQLSSSLRWDPHENVHYALMAGDPTVEEYKGHTQFGANRLAAIGLPVLTLVPSRYGGQVRPQVLGGKYERGEFTFAWPIWRGPATLTTVQSLLSHPQLREGKLRYLGVEHVFVTRRISTNKLMNFTKAQ